MTVLLALAAAFGYGMSDFLGAPASRRLHVAVVTLIVQAGAGVISLAVAISAAATFDAGVAGWGCLAGVGSAVGTLALYRGLSVGRMAVVAPVSAVVAAALPAVVGLASGERLSGLGWAGVALALPATVLVTRLPDDHSGPTGLREGVVAGLGFALLFIGLNRAGDFIALLAAALGVVGGECFILASADSLTVAAIVTSLYPAFTVALAYVVLREHVNRVQAVGLALATVSVALIGA